ncbi:MAG: LamB/YcsF family protein, partial [Halopseudomonas sp.]
GSKRARPLLPEAVDVIIAANFNRLLTLHADSLCVHGDNAESVAVVARIRAALDAL